MGTKGRHWKQKNKKWSDEIAEWLKARCPAREHGYGSRKELLDDLNRTFKASFSLNAMSKYLADNGMQLGFAQDTPKGKFYSQARPIGSVRGSGKHLKIKVSADKWISYGRYVWEKAHPGESAEGRYVIPLDGDNSNFDADNLECVTKAELIGMAKLGAKKHMGREERVNCLLRARIALSITRLKNKMEGRP